MDIVGHLDRWETREANDVADIIAMLMILADSRDANVLLEQPASGRLITYPSMAKVNELLGLVKHNTSQGSFGGMMVKPTGMWTTMFHAHASNFVRPRPPQRQQG